MIDINKKFNPWYIVIRRGKMSDAMFDTMLSELDSLERLMMKKVKKCYRQSKIAGELMF